MKDLTYLIYQELEGSISRRDRNRLEIWLKKDTDNKAVYQSIEKIFKNADESILPEIPNIDTNWSNIEEKLNDSIKQPANRKIKRIWSTKKIDYFPNPKIAFSFCILLFLFGAVFLFRHFYNTSSQNIVTANQQRIEKILNDGSTIKLNCGSRITVQRRFPKYKRHVYLEGETFFQIKKDNRPFIVTTQHAEIKVLGTQFNIWSRGNETRVIVKKGHISFRSLADTTEWIHLHEGMMSRVTGNETPLQPKQINADYYLGWLQNRLVFDRTPLFEVVDELERYYDVSIRVKNRNLLNETITSVFDSLPLDKALYSICVILDMQVEYRNGEYILKTL